jgi:OOP family OmpA-OmpF porin
VDQPASGRRVQILSPVLVQKIVAILVLCNNCGVFCVKTYPFDQKPASLAGFFNIYYYKRLVMFKNIAVAATLALLASSTLAADRGHIYAGADFGTTDIEGLSGRSHSFGSFVGYQITPHFGVEANVRRLADTRESFTDFRVVQMGLSLVGTLPLNNGLSVYGRVGSNKLEGRASAGSVVKGETVNKFSYGFGASYAFTPVIAGRIEMTKLTNYGDNVSAGVVFQF